MKTGRPMDEAAVDAAVRSARAGDAEAFAELYRLFFRRVRGLCRHLLGSEPAAEDAASEVFLRARHAMDRYDTAQPFSRWLLAIASHHCIDLLRRRGAERRLFSAEEVEAAEPLAAGPSPLAELVAAEQRATVRAAVERLPERYRLPLVLRYYSELSYDDIARALGLPRNTVANLIFRAKQELRWTLAPAAKEWVQ